MAISGDEHRCPRSYLFSKSCQLLRHADQDYSIARTVFARLQLPLQPQLVVRAICDVQTSMLFGNGQGLMVQGRLRYARKTEK